ncbi:MAG: HAD-IIA family hydrolase [Clostridia bacterium]|nr:HAD-IIA family hydrolase [Clostridia bacterium]
MRDDLQNLIANTDVFLLDMDGTIYLDSTPIGDMVSTLDSIRRAGKKIVYFTNNSSKTVDEYRDKLTRIGFWRDEDIIYTSGMASIWYLRKYHADSRVYLLGTDALKRSYVDSGILLVEDDADVAVLAYDTSLTFAKIKRFNEMLVKGARYISTHPDLVCPTDDIFMPDVGSFIKMFEASSGRTPEVIIGKPFTYMGEMILDQLAVETSRVTMVGDRLYTDVKFGLNCGFNSVLVLSGETTMEDYRESGIEATLVLDSLNDVAKYL